MQMVKCHDAKQEDIFFLIFDELRDIVDSEIQLFL